MNDQEPGAPDHSLSQTEAKMSDNEFSYELLTLDDLDKEWHSSKELFNSFLSRLSRNKEVKSPAPLSSTPPVMLNVAADALCSKCNTPLKEGAKFCRICGTPVAPKSPVQVQAPPAPALCSKCSALLEEDAKFCTKCGAPVMLKTPQEPPAVAVCGKCNAPLKEGAKFCTRCGAPV